VFSLQALNQPQREAVLFGDGPLAVIAGSGAGKTRVLTYRAAHLVKKRGFLPSRMIVSTFTNKAAEEMIERLEPMIGANSVERMRIGTFHSICRKILMDLLEYHSRARGEFEKPSLVMGGGRYMMMEGIVRSLGKKEGLSTKGMLRMVSLWKNYGWRPQDVPAQSVLKDQIDAYSLYEAKLRENNKIDFDDMLYWTYWLLQEERSQKFLKRLQDKLDHILIDEAQDTNPIQFMLLRLFLGEKKLLTLVGDDWQAIFNFRGSSVKGLFRFLDEYKATIIKLEQNYRSTKTIVGLGNNLIRFNEDQIDKTLFTSHGVGLAPDILVSTEVDDEARNVMEKIEVLVGEEGYSLGDIAILYRTNAQSRAIVDQLILGDVPHKVFAKFGFYDRREIKDLITYMRLVVNPYDADFQDFKRIWNRPSRYLPAKLLSAVEDFQIDRGYDSIWEALTRFPDYGLNGGQTRNLDELMRLIRETHEWIEQARVEKRPIRTAEVFDRILTSTGYREWLERGDDDEDEIDNIRELNLDSLLAGAIRFSNPRKYLQFIDSIGDVHEDKKDFLSLMTCHASKGQEWPVVIVIGVSEGLMPHNRADDLEEERRICYVAATRAKERLILSSIHGLYHARKRVTPSRFITEMGLKIPQVIGGEHIGYVAPCAEVPKGGEIFVVRDGDEMIPMNQKDLANFIRPTPGSEAEAILDQAADAHLDDLDDLR
jgi:DNA helicase-2/ATP-dependent DNA helicase PcrA